MHVVLRAPHYVLSVASDIPTDLLAQRLPGLCKIASRTQLPSIIRSAATPGVPIQITHRPPTEIPHPGRNHVFHDERVGRVLAPDHRRTLDRHLPAAALWARQGED
ncbi:MAG: type VI secretion system baseplate subunit TssK [Chthoniobacteraceae bacterium]